MGGRIGNPFSKNQCKKEVLTPQRKDIFHIHNSRWYSKNVRKRPRIPRTLSKAGTTWRESQWRTSRKGFNRQNQKMTLEPRESFGRFKVTIHRHHIEPRVQPYVPNEETFSIPLQYIDVTRASYTNLVAPMSKKLIRSVDLEEPDSFLDHENLGCT